MRERYFDIETLRRSLQPYIGEKGEQEGQRGKYEPDSDVGAASEDNVVVEGDMVKDKEDSGMSIC